MSNPLPLSQTQGQSLDEAIGANTRARRACDACRARKVKCGPPHHATCKNCLLLQIECRRTYSHRRRGPKNRYVEQLQRSGQEDASSPSSLDALYPSDPLATTPSTNGSSVNSSRPSPLDPVNNEFEIPAFRELAPFSTIQCLIDDWFALLHPLSPFLHRSSFLIQLAHPTESQDPDFIDLVIALCACVVGSLRKRQALYGQSVTVSKCRDILLRRYRIEPEPSINLTKCQVKYTFALALGAEYGMDIYLPHLFLVEATQGVSHLLAYQTHSLTSQAMELAKRLYWLCFVANCTVGLHGRPACVPINPKLQYSRLEPLPLTDLDLESPTLASEPEGAQRTSYIPGLRALSHLFLIWHQSQQGDCDDPAHIRRYLKLIQSATESFPPELRWRGGLSRPSGSDFGTEVQMVDLYITTFHIRSFLLGQMDGVLSKLNSSVRDQEVVTARQALVDDMLTVVYTVEEEKLEINGQYLIKKLRDIGGSLLDDGNQGYQPYENLDRLLNKLAILDV